MKYFLKILMVLLLVSCINDTDNTEEDNINYEHEVSLTYFENNVDSIRVTITSDNKKIIKSFLKDKFIIKFSASKKSDVIIKYDVYRNDSIIVTDIDSLNLYSIKLPTVKEIQTNKKIYDTITVTDTFFYTDTLFSIDTIVFNDSTLITVNDTLTDTLYINNRIIDTVTVERTVIDTIIQTEIIKDTVISYEDTIIQIIHDTVTVYDTIICLTKKCFESYKIP